MAVLLRAAACLSALVSSALAQRVFVSEIHYDNTGADEGEAVEITGPVDTSLAGWTLALYNGNTGAQYSTIDLSGTVVDQSNGFGAMFFFEAGIQNGSPDGLALVDDVDQVIQFLSYEGTFDAVDGPAVGMSSTDIGESQASSNAVGQSMQLEGKGSEYPDFSWTTMSQSFGTINEGMVFCAIDECDKNTPSPTTPAPTPVPEAVCAQLATAISTIQGDGGETPFASMSVTVKGIVTAVFSGLSGFYVQDAGDGDPTTSDGVFIYVGSSPSVSVGDEVAVQGSASEYFNNTQISASTVEVCGTGNAAPAATTLTLPSDEATLESVEGMVVFIDDAVVTDNYNAGSYGEVTVAAERLWQFTQVNPPGTVPENFVGKTVIIDDGSSAENPNPAVYVDRASDIRVGQTLDVEGIMAYSFGSYRVHPTTTGVTLAEATNPRPTTLPEKDDKCYVRVASFNVLNYFTTLGERGADTVEQREAQLAKITAGVMALDADVIGIVEVENDYNSSTPSIQVIVDSLNDADPVEQWRYVVPSVIPLGADEIAVGIIYRSRRVRGKGDSDVLDFNDDKTRAALAQTFTMKCKTNKRKQRCKEKSPQGSDRWDCLHRAHDCKGKFTVAVNHFKSKGSDCEDLDDPDIDDGQGNCNLTRTSAMTRLIDWVTGSDIGVSATDNILLAGDFNAYAMEDPIQTAVDANFVDMASFRSDYPRVSSYVFFGESGTLDYILASPSAVSNRVGDLLLHHVNAEETNGLTYSNCLGDGSAGCIFVPDQYRSSDHDMVAQDFNMD